jgi:CheY-like chemotaxis protein
MPTIKILVVDDLVLNRILLTEIIENAGYRYAQANNGKEAIDRLMKEDFDVVFMDIEMPVMNGFETTRYIRNKFLPPKNKIPVIAVTAHDPVTFFEDYKEVGFNALISKPFSLEKIKKTVASVLNLNP